MRLARKCLWAALFLAGSGSFSWPPSAMGEGRGDYVVLLHGLGRTHRAMRRLAGRLAGAGYRVANLHYPGRDRSVEELAAWLDEQVRLECADAARRVHFVTHSMGGIVVRAYLKDRPAVNLGRVVMLAPPNGGSELVDPFREARWAKRFFGPAFCELGTGEKDLPRRLGRVDFELGVIAGDRTANPLYSWLVPGEDDGKVSLENARVAGMTDFVVMHATHTFMMRNADVVEQVVEFLARGRFRRPGERW